MLNSILTLDYSLSARLRLKETEKTIWKIATLLSHSGDSWYWMGALGIAWFVGTPEWHRTAGLMAIGVFGLAVAVMAVKFIIRRRRPEGEWGQVYRSIDPHSFPSGHAARAALLAVMMMSLGPQWLGILFILWVPVVSIARVVTGVHYLSDVIVGIFIGIVGGLFMVAAQNIVVSLLFFLF